ncbi:hypothetical protein ANOM_009754 [Aspergillus nomiae NRRL 13137]|uniref:Flagellin N-terminal domain-containing protein n=1 Tax=Aspergillus nomiae NRRL (strain ATCC 15546 / NRRL 13137 / CBS 260.88 / M93) TaxID=1509407 RepID=A0A0L1ISV3_ASPN3|nr:uncharacterized protein ANOM_009754 [Aspergillus nomiae NRRL 13137]KNG82577.1 hypothetical protein ANOM_009754 [Aspergillus nomiae NRRL 13137]
MSNVVRTNLSALNAHRNLGKVTSQQKQSSERLSSGYRINRAADDAAGLAITQKVTSQINSLEQAAMNAGNTQNLMQTVEGTLENITSKTQRIRQLVGQAANDTMTQSDKDKAQLEIDELVSDIHSELDTAEYNGKKLFNGSGETSSASQVGEDEGQSKSVIVALDSAAIIDKLNSIAINKTADASQISDVDTVDNVLEDLAGARAEIAAQQNALEKSNR